MNKGWHAIFFLSAECKSANLRLIPLSKIRKFLQCVV